MRLTFKEGGLTTLDVAIEVHTEADGLARVALAQRRGIGWTLWQRVHKAVKVETGYDDAKRRRVMDEAGVCRNPRSGALADSSQVNLRLF